MSAREGRSESICVSACGNVSLVVLMWLWTHVQEHVCMCTLCPWLGQPSGRAEKRGKVAR